MKKILPVLLLVASTGVMGQSGFTPEAYLDFVEQNADLTATELLEQYPAKTTYYSSRQHPYDLNNIPYYDSIDKKYAFTSGEEALLGNHGFIVSERLSYLSWINAYASIYTADLPLFLSTDFILFTLHQSYDEILKTLEYKVLEPGLSELLEAMYNSYTDVYESYAGQPDLVNALADVDLYIAVARSLLTGEEYLPQQAGSEQYVSVMEAIGEEKLAYMPLFTRSDLDRKLDFSQFKPRGHYTDLIWTSQGEKTLERYFRTMMWLGRIDFLLTKPPSNPWEDDWRDEDIRRMQLSALLLNEVLYQCGKKALLDRHEALVSFMVGPGDNLSPDELQSISANGLTHISDLLDPGIFEQFREQLNSSDDYGQQIMSHFFLVDPSTENPAELPVSFKLLGQKFLVDSYIFSQVVFDRIVFEGVKQYRMLPDPLDIFAVLGNENAMMLLQNEMEKYKYAYKISELKYLVDAYDDTFWKQSLYNTWLAALVKLNPPSSVEGMPYFMQTAAWNHEKLNTQLTSWAQLRHDNILYAKQSYTGGTGCSYPYTYVEPYPEFYNHIRLFAERAETFFMDMLSVSYPDLAADIAGYYDTYAGIMKSLEVIASRELSGTPLTEEELIFLKTMINHFMASGPSVSGWINDLLFPGMDMWDFDFTVADVHTQPTEPGGAVVGNVLHVGNGKINLAVVIAPNSADGNGQTCYVGPVGAFHTTVRNNFERLDDDAWEKMFLEGAVPPRPDWAYAYLADINGDTVKTGAVLKGIPYTGIDHVTTARNNPGYLLVYPNPVTDRVKMRLFLNEPAMVNGALYDLSGRRLKAVSPGNLSAGEHDLEIYLEDPVPGICFVRMQVNENVFARKIAVQ